MMSEKNTVLFVEPRRINYVFNVLKRAVIVLKDEWNYVFYCGKGDKSYWDNKLPSVIEIRELHVNNMNAATYSDFLKTKELWLSLQGEFVLTLQLDAWIVNCPPYNINYFINMNKSYIGGNMKYDWGNVWRYNNIPRPNIRNFNGGLSLRKRNDMIKIIETFPPMITTTEGFHVRFNKYTEDVYFTIGGYLLNMDMGDNEECHYFAVHSIYKDKCFGMHNLTYEQDIGGDNVFKNVSLQYPRLKTINPYLSHEYKIFIR
jgi:hypothetical protein